MVATAATTATAATAVAATTLMTPTLAEHVLLGTALKAAAFFAFIATAISLVAAWTHLKCYVQPVAQRFTIRIFVMVPVFAIASYISLVSLDAAYFVDTLRDLYESFVLYCFFSLLVGYVGGERKLVLLLDNVGSAATIPHVMPVSLFKKSINLGDPTSYLAVKRGIMQYVYIKPALAAATMILRSLGNYHEGDFSLHSGYFWVTFFYNISVCTSLYCLGIFIVATRKHLEQFRPLAKFMCIKATIFFSFWQSVAISILVALGVIRDTESFSVENIAVFAQDWLICLEMVGAAIGMWYAFSVNDYLPSQEQPPPPTVYNLEDGQLVHQPRASVGLARLRLRNAIKDAMGLKDVWLDSLEAWYGNNYTYRAFEPADSTLIVGSRHAMGSSVSQTSANTPHSEDHRWSLASNATTTSAFSETASMLDGVASPSPSAQAEHEADPEVVRRKLLAGLRYSHGGKSKYWLPDARQPAVLSPQSSQLQQQQQSLLPTLGITRSLSVDTSAASSDWSFWADDIELDEEVEAMYADAKRHPYGDYNCPLVEVVLWRPANFDERNRTLLSYGGTGNHSYIPIISPQPVDASSTHWST
ncbi:DUF300-domain-containing protein [Ramicandelaber brevisporus]|nr:DUF300-domain-containing protein [Ramicandelaber brevisporus]